MCIYYYYFYLSLPEKELTALGTGTFGQYFSLIFPLYLWYPWIRNNIDEENVDVVQSD